jgi:ATP-dependent Clp protease ATP-binding subunit ClpA
MGITEDIKIDQFSTNCQLERPTLIVVLGPTGVGKTKVSLQLAEQLA